MILARGRSKTGFHAEQASERLFGAEAEWRLERLRLRQPAAMKKIRSSMVGGTGQMGRYRHIWCVDNQ